MDSEAVAQEILGPMGDFRSACAINRALGKLLTLTAQKRIPARDSAVIAYIAQLLLQTLRPLHNELYDTGGRVRVAAVINETYANIRDELPKTVPWPGSGPAPTLQENVAKCAAFLKSAGFNLPAGLVPRPEIDEEQDDEEGDESNEENERADARDNNAQ